MPALEDDRFLERLGDAFCALHDGQRGFVASLAPADLARDLSYVDTQGSAQSRPVWQTLLQVVNHGTHHRAETALLLTALGTPPRQLDYVFFEIERAGGPPRLA